MIPIPFGLPAVGYTRPAVGGDPPGCTDPDTTYRATLDEFGVFLCASILSRKVVDLLLTELEMLDTQGERGGSRNLLARVPSLRHILDRPGIRGLVEPVLGVEAIPVRALLFDKFGTCNWGVAWHQDLTIAVQHRIELPGFGPWSVKAGIDHVQPPLEVLRNMVTLRLHLDQSTIETGTLLIVPGSHRNGRLETREESQRGAREKVWACVADPGDVLVMHPLVLHASRKATKAARRRVIHIEFAASPLPAPLNWYESRSL